MDVEAHIITSFMCPFGAAFNDACEGRIHHGNNFWLNKNELSNYLDYQAGGKWEELF